MINFDQHHQLLMCSKCSGHSKACISKNIHTQVTPNLQRPREKCRRVHLRYTIDRHVSHDANIKLIACPWLLLSVVQRLSKQISEGNHVRNLVLFVHDPHLVNVVLVHGVDGVLERARELERDRERLELRLVAAVHFEREGERALVVEAEREVGVVEHAAHVAVGERALGSAVAVKVYHWQRRDLLVGHQSKRIDRQMVAVDCDDGTCRLVLDMLELRQLPVGHVRAQLGHV
mmetsp:Transcript_36312/g.76423  ORF Transcript_36312/g.76423 Transcript_36312/m.76423 type:complete len:232 (-) Transcript_36312:635-1330(-)